MYDKSFNLSDDRRSVTVQVARNPDVFVRMNVSEIAALVRGLTGIRRQMEPGVPRQFTQGKTYDGTGNPAWAVEKQSNGDTVLLHICEPGIDWLHFGFPAEQARRLGELLIAAAGEDRPEGDRRENLDAE